MTQIGERNRDSQTYAIIGAAMEVHRTLGPGFLEPVYQAAFELELELRGVPYVREMEIGVRYKGALLDVRYRADFVCFGETLVELKALNRLTTIMEAQVIHYLVASGLKKGILLNFGTPSLQFRHFVGPAFASSESVASVASVDRMVRTP